MRQSRATRILLLFLAAVTILLLITGEENLALATGVMTGLVAAMAFGVQRFIEQPRGDAHAEQAAALGLAPADGLAADLLALPHPLIARPFETRDVTHVYAGVWRDLPVQTFEFDAAYAGRDAATNPHGRQLCVLFPAPGRADVAIAPTDHGVAPVTLGDDPDAIAAATDPTLRAWLAEIDPAIGFQVADERLLVYRPRAQPWVLPELLETGAAFLARAPV